MKKVFSLMLLFATLLTFMSCGDEPDNTKLSKTDYSMFHGDTQVIEGVNLTDIVWDSENEFVATVGKNAISGQYVGKTTVRSVAKKLAFTVEVKPVYNIYEEPCLRWGASRAYIKAKYGTPQSEDFNSVIYKTANPNAPIMIFMFENDMLSSSGVVCKVSAASQLADFLLERYVPVEVDINNYTATLLHCHGKISNPQIDYGVGMQFNTSIGGIVVAYVNPDNAKARSVGAIDFSQVFESIDTALNKR